MFFCIIQLNGNINEIKFISNGKYYFFFEFLTKLI
jgi:hypothetical protein